MIRVTDAERRARLGRRHHLASLAAKVERATRALIGLHSSDPASVFLSARARVKNFHIGDLERALYERRSLVRMLGEGKKWGGDFGISTRVLFLLATEGRIVRARPKGSWISSQYRWATTASWIGPLPDLDRGTARSELVRRWLHAFGPGTLGAGTHRVARGHPGHTPISYPDREGSRYPMTPTERDRLHADVSHRWS